MDKLICPFCGDEMKLTSLYMDGNHRYSHKYIGALSGGKDRCPFDGETLPLRALQEIHNMRKALEIAWDGLKHYCTDSDNWSCVIDFTGDYDNAPSEFADKAIEQITALKQKD